MRHDIVLTYLEDCSGGNISPPWPLGRGGLNFHKLLAAQLSPALSDLSAKCSSPDFCALRRCGVAVSCVMAEEPLDLFTASAPTPPRASAVDLPSYRQRLGNLAAHEIYIGTSSWKYPGWCGPIYDEQRYLTRGKFTEAQFNRTCLAEYAEAYRSVCVDAGYYQFPMDKYFAELCAQVPDGFRFAFKVTDEITIRKSPGLPRFGARAGTTNPNSLNAEMFRRLFLGPLEGYRSKVGPLIFEFSTFHQQDFQHGRNFVAAQDQRDPQFQ
jgi:hypothetical protein